MRTGDDWGIAAVVVGLIIVVVGACGWVANIVKLIGMDMEPLTPLLIVRAIGIFIPPLGAVMGFV
jgi:hypothetical protein